VVRLLQEAIGAALRPASKLVARGHEVAVVGGAVRDLFLCRESTEADLATSASTEEILDLWPGAPVMGRPPTATVIIGSGGYRVDISTFQGDTLAEDLGRRDLTINAMALSIDGAVVDPWGGRTDLARGLLRFTGDPLERLASDPLRAVRLARFASELPGFSVDSASREACRGFASRLSSIPLPRIGREIFKALAGDLPAFLDTLDEQGLLASVLPFWAEIPADRRAATLDRVHRASPLSDDRAVRAACLLAEDGEGIAATVSAWSWPKEMAGETKDLVRYCPALLHGADARFWAGLYRSRGEGWLGKLILFGYIESLEHGLSATVPRVERLMESAEFMWRLGSFGRRITGEEVMALTGLKSGPEVGAILADLDEAIALGKVKDRRQAVFRVIDRGRKVGTGPSGFPYPERHSILMGGKY
jgi:tRNA nucleotidyltransferase/poly(A) polymerase